jgi:hypothetical protein
MAIDQAVMENGNSVKSVPFSLFKPHVLALAADWALSFQ